MAKLQNFPQYDKQILVSVYDIDEEIIPDHEVHHRFNLRNFLTLFAIEPQAQSHQPGKRGRGTLLYDRHEVLEALNFYENYFQ